MIYEHRTYYLNPGRMPVFNERFKTIIMPLFQKYQMKVVGVWQTAIGQSNEFTYIVAFDNLGERETKWDVFLKDPEFLRYRELEQRDGPSLSHIHNKILRPTDYSPLP